MRRVYRPFALLALAALIGCAKASAPTIAEPPGAPTGVSATAGNGQATLLWTAPAQSGSSAVSGYTVTATPGGLTASTTGATTVTFPGLINGTAYTFTVHATSAIGNGPESAPTTPITPGAAPNAPSAVTAVAGDASAVVSWKAPASTGGRPITGYTVTTSPGGQQVSTLGDLSAVVTGLTNGTSYTFTVHATNAVGASAESAASSAIIPAPASEPPGAPLGVVALAGNTQANITWNRPESSGSSAITGYVVTADPGGATTSTTGAASATLTGLTNGTAYVFTVQAISAAGTGPASLPSTPVIPSNIPQAPTNVVAVAGDSSAIVTWSAPADDGGSPILSYTLSQTGGSLSITTTDTFATLTGLTNGLPYSFTVTANNVNGPGPSSLPSLIVVPQALPGAPTDVTATAGDGQATVAWTAPSSDGGENIHTYTVTASPGGLQTTVSAPALSATVTGLTNGAAYTFTVHATTFAGNSAESTPSSPVTPLGAASAATSTLAVTPILVNADGLSTATITVTVKDANGDALAGQAVTLSVSGAGNQLVPSSGTTNASGVFVAKLSSTAVETKTVTPIVGGQSFTGLKTSVTFSATKCSSFTLGAPTNDPVGNAPAGVATGDFNDDGWLDLAVTNRLDKTVSILLGATGGFGPATAYAVGARPVGAAVADLNGDGWLDLVVANSGNNTLSVLLGKGDGTFGTQKVVSAGSLPQTIAVGDLNADGIPDLVVANQGIGGGNVSAFVGNGDGTFAPLVDYTASGNPVAILLGDFNGDGKLDLAAANTSTNNVSIILGNGDGSFSATVTTNFAAGSHPDALVTGDFNGDGKLDLATANLLDSTVSVLLGVGDGTFATQVTYSVGNAPTSLATADLDRDGVLDLVVASASTNSVNVLLGTGTGTFGTATSFSTGSAPVWVGLGDFDHQGSIDVAVVNSNDNNVSILLNGCSAEL